MESCGDCIQEFFAGSGLPGATFTNNGTQRTLTDPVATGVQKFYRIEITKP